MITTTWTPLTPEIDAFVEEYDRLGSSPDSDVGSLFAEQFLVLDPNRALVLSREALIASLPMRRQMFENAGVAPLRRIRASQMVLDDNHLLVTTDWQADRVLGEPLVIESTFLIRREKEGLRVLTYLNPIDVASAISKGQ